MKDELDKQLCDEYPNIFRDRHKTPEETAMCWGFPGDGWFTIIDELCAKLQFLEKVGVFPVAVQVKEKFGLLRVYCRIEYDRKWKSQAQRRLWRDIVFDCCHAAEFESGHTCEKCGNHGSVRELKAGGVQTLCDDCGKIRAKRKKRRTEESERVLGEAQ
jgi:hypothetical protein